MVVENGELEIANPQFALDLNQAIESVKKISALYIGKLYCYHGGVVANDIKSKFMNLLKKCREYNLIAYRKCMKSIWSKPSFCYPG